MEFIDLKLQYQRYKSSIDTRIKQVLDHGHFIMGPEVYELESKLADFVGVKHCITVASGTVSLEIALRALDIGYGDEVITVPFSWISTAEVIAAVGATPVFVDIEYDSFNMDPKLLEDSITEKTKAIIPVSLFGQLPDLESIISIAKKRDIPVIEDAAQSFGATRNGKNSCGFSTIGSTSFFPAKTLGCYGDGGALFTDNDKLAIKMKAIRTHGGIKRHQHKYIGLNGRFDTLQAAVILGKLDYFHTEIQERSRIGKRYSELLNGQVITPKVSNGNTHVYAQYTIRVNHHIRKNLVDKIKKNNIPVGIYYPKCIHEQPAFHYLNYQKGDFPISEQASMEVISLPMHPFLESKDQDIICEQIVVNITDQDLNR